MTITKLTPYDKVLKNEDILISGNHPLTHGFFQYLKKYQEQLSEKDLGKTKILSILRRFVIDMALVLKMDPQDLKDTLALSEVRRVAVQMLISEIKKEEQATIIIGGSKKSPQDSVELLSTVASHRKDKMYIDKEKLTDKLDTDSVPF